MTLTPPPTSTVFQAADPYSTSHVSRRIVFASNCSRVKSSSRQVACVKFVLVKSPTSNCHVPDHIIVLKTKRKSVLGAVLRVKLYLNKDTLLTLYHSLLISHIRYCITNWRFENKTVINQLQCICDKFVRMIFKLPCSESTRSSDGGSISKVGGGGQNQ